MLRIRNEVQARIDQFKAFRCDHEFKELRRLSGPDVMYLVRCSKCKALKDWGFIGLASEEEEKELRHMREEQGNPYWVVYGDYYERPRRRLAGPASKPASAYDFEARRWLDAVFFHSRRR